MSGITNLPHFTCEIKMKDDDDWRKFSFQAEDTRTRFMDRVAADGGQTRLAALRLEDLPPVLQRPIEIHCGECGGENVMRDAWAVWSVENQAWELGNVFDDGHCEDCDKSVTLVEVEVDKSQS